MSLAVLLWAAHGDAIAQQNIRVGVATSVDLQPFALAAQKFFNTNGHHAIINHLTDPDEFLIMTESGDKAPSIIIVRRAYHRVQQDLAEQTLFDVVIAPEGANVGNESDLILAQGLQVVIHPENPLHMLTAAQIADVLSGRIGRWELLGGRQGAIRLILPDFGADLDAVFASFGLPAQAIKPDAEIVSTMERVAEIVSEDRMAFGLYTGARPSKAVVVALALDCGRPVLPLDFKLAAKRYPLVRRIQVTKLSPRNSELSNAFVEYMKKADQGAVLTSRGFVPVGTFTPPMSRIANEFNAAQMRIWALRTALDRAAVEQYLATIGSAQGIGEPVMFASDSADLDVIAVSKLTDVIRVLASQGADPSRIRIYGFTDDSGGAERNLMLSRSRAEAIAAELRRGGIAVPGDSIIAMGTDVPASCNTSVEGKAANRRAEVWLK